MKSYGRAPTFLLATGYQQVRSVVATLAGDHAGALHRDRGPPAAALCARNRNLLARAGRRPAGSVAGWSAEAAAAASAADWSTATRC